MSTLNKSFNFGNKSNTLRLLEGQLSYSKVLPQVSITYSQWLECNSKISKKSYNPFPSWFDETVIVRSSSSKEDTKSESLAGQFLSVGNVKGLKNIESAINDVFDSFKSPSPSDIVFIQPYLKNVVVSGVAFTFDPSLNSHYYVINYDNNSGLTNTVTSGSTNNLKTHYVHKGIQCEFSLSWLKCLVMQLKELENLFKSEFLDIEFAIDSNFNIFILQVRPLIFKKTDSVSLEELSHATHNIINAFSRLNCRRSTLHGKRSIFGIMPDWNPAEIIGLRPNPLAMSLYKELITDGTWAYQRDNYGYKNLRSYPLLIDFGGLPYIDVRVSFNSFVPRDVNSELADRLVDYYISELELNPNNHDKIEFEIIFSCYTFDIKDKFKKLISKGFSELDIHNLSKSLLSLTNNIIRSDGLWAMDLKKIDILISKQNSILESDLPTIDKIYWLIEDCKRYGTLPFAGLARAGFIAVQMLKSLVSIGCLDSDDYQHFMLSLDTVSSRLAFDLQSLDKSDFLNIYGHLRPGTYDILSSRYDEYPDFYFDWTLKTSLHDDISLKKSYNLSLDQLNKINNLLTKHGINHDVVSLFNFIKSAIEGREYAKFIFTKSLSNVLKLIGEYAHGYDVSLKNASYIDYSIFKKIYSSSDDVLQLMLNNIKQNKTKYKITEKLRLPQLIITQNDIISFLNSSNLPNYITRLKITSPILELEKSKQNSSLSKKIIFITSADPGYDWIFTKNISGFVTMYGGANSHMAIRANELSVPAIIGVGEADFKFYAQAKIIEMDCLNQTIRIIK